MKKVILFLLLIISITCFSGCRKDKTQEKTETPIVEVTPTPVEPSTDVVEPTENEETKEVTSTPEITEEEIVPEEPEPTVPEVPTEELESTVPDVPTEEPEPTVPEVPTEEPEPTVPDVPTEEPEPTVPEVPTEEPEPTVPEVPTEEPEPTVPEIPTEEPEPTIPETPTEEPELSDLSIPVLVIDEYGVVTWDAVIGATHYNYIINGQDFYTTSSLSVLLENESNISVQAANDLVVGGWSYAITNYDTSDKYEIYEEDIYIKFYNTNLSTSKVKTGDKITKPNNPVKENYTFDNWYKDPFFKEVFDFNQPVYSNTIIYANFIPSDLIKDTYFWVKGCPKMSSAIMSAGTNSDWHFIPLSINENAKFREFYVTVNVTGASETNPCYFIIMDGFSNDSNRKYWKNNGNDFTIKSDGVYNIYFSLVNEYAPGVNALAYKVSNTVYSASYDYNLNLDTPVVSVDSSTNIASWNAVANASYYEVVIDNIAPIITTNLNLSLAKGSHISVRAVNEITASKWSLPKANYNVVLIEKPVEDVSVYFVGYDSYMVSPGDEILAPEAPTKQDYEFVGWSLEMNGSTLSFPYTVIENTVFYAKWSYKYDYTTRVYYNLVDSSNNYVKGLTWNHDNYSFYEYETGEVTLKKGVTYYITSVDNPSEKYGPYTVSSSGIYKLYFSDEHVWDDGRNIYIAEVTKTIYFTNSKKWTDSICVYMWNKTDGVNNYGWPGITMEFDSTNNYGEDIYKVTINLSKYDYIIFSYGTFYGEYYETSSQTVDLKLSNYSNNAFYVTEKNSEGKYNVGTWNK